ncbi:hypothetical protein KDK95_14665 [Actinospica sp. MGRD01-02]|uniref:DUF4913 domain-containing protein n=1 Tax=Actinospica acidithermotolerans TaxID=2828514 RepID=A0A941EBI5_9ACTN|nr:hypothetical protein [Actinospica acidithermotolerans]MBR7827558.1 hypothetical protein [Actinospica acidithermotolerans]
MTGFDDRHAAPPTVGFSAGRRVRGRPGTSPSRLTRQPRVTADAIPSDQPVPTEANATPFIEWHAMNEPEYVLAWQQLREWTTWLANRYRLSIEDRLPNCWPRHPELIEELWALRAWRSEAYGTEGSGQSATYWHQALVTFLSHVSGWWAGGCRAGHDGSNTDITSETVRAWAESDPMVGIPTPLRPKASTPDNTETEGEITMPNVNTLTGAQMQALTTAGLAHPQHETIVAFTYYDGSWWAYGSPNEHDPAAPPADETGTWFRADDLDLASDHTFYPQRSATD